MLGQREAREVGADLGDERFSSAPGHTGNGLHERHGLLLSGQPLFEVGAHPRDGRIQVLQMGELLTRAGKT